MKRRSFIKRGTVAISSFGLSHNYFTNLDLKKRYKPLKTFVTIDQHRVSFFAEGINESLKVIHIACKSFISCILDCQVSLSKISFDF